MCGYVIHIYINYQYNFEFLTYIIYLASLLSSEVGFDALYFGRIDYEDHQLRYI